LPALLTKGYKVVVLEKLFFDTSKIKDVLVQGQISFVDIDSVIQRALFEEYSVDTNIRPATGYGRESVMDLMSEPRCRKLETQETQSL